MAVRAFTSNPDSLIRSIRESIEDGTIKTWSLDKDGDLVYESEQWKYKAWMRPRIRDDQVLFSILGSTTQTMKKSTYAIFHARLVEMLLRHFDDQISRASATANVVQGDLINASSNRDAD
jgi:hypothetical protein